MSRWACTAYAKKKVYFLYKVRQNCAVAPNFFLNLMYWILDRLVAQNRLGVSVGEELFTDLDYADDVALLAEMLCFMVAKLPALQEKAASLRLQINYIKAKIWQIGVPRLTQPSIQLAEENVELVNDFVYLGSLISHEGESAT